MRSLTLEELSIVGGGKSEEKISKLNAFLITEGVVLFFTVLEGLKFGWLSSLIIGGGCTVANLAYVHYCL